MRLLVTNARVPQAYIILRLSAILAVHWLQQELAAGSRNNRFMTRLWHDVGSFRIRREVPRKSSGVSFCRFTLVAEPAV